MATAFKRKRIKTGPHSWINKTQRADGTTFTSVSNKAGNTTTNLSSNGVRKTQNNDGWRLRLTTHKPKSSSTSSYTKPRKTSGSLPSFSFFNSKKAKQTYKPKKISAAERKQIEADREERQMQTIIAFASISDLAEGLALEKLMTLDKHDISILNTIPEVLRRMVVNPTSYEYFDVVSEMIVELERIEQKQVNAICKRGVASLKNSFISLKDDMPSYLKYTDSSIYLSWPFIVIVTIICFIIQLLF